MEVDDDEGTQRPRRVNDYVIELDFDILDDDEKEVNLDLRNVSSTITHFTSPRRTALQKRVLRWTLRSRN